MTPVTRRSSDPSFCWKVWGSIRQLKQKGHLPDRTTIMLMLDRKDKKDFDTKLNEIIKDKLIRNTCEGYKIPEEVQDDDHDWFCWCCHKAGPVIPCGCCYRVYHSHCQEELSDSNVCRICAELTDFEEESPSKIEKANKAFFHLLTKLKETGITKQIDSLYDERENCINLIIKKQINIEMIDSKISLNGYKSIAEIEADIHLIVHNIGIRYGVSSFEYGIAIYFLELYYKERELLSCCFECYSKCYMHNDYASWFTDPCEEPHKIVFAKSDYCPYWPAKVMGEKDDEELIVWYFGSKKYPKDYHFNTISPENVKYEYVPSKKKSQSKDALECALREYKKYLKKLKDNKQLCP